MMQAWPLDGHEYTAAPIGAYTGTRTRGVFSAQDCFAVTAAGGRNIRVSGGLAWLKPEPFWGVAAYDKDAVTLTVDVASGALSRWVGVAISYDKTANTMPRVILRYGDYAQSPVKPVPRQDEAYEEIIVASILQRAASVEIAPDDIEDERLNDEMCGIMRDGVTGIPTSTLQNQASALIAKLKAQLERVITGSDVMLKSVYDKDNNGAADLYGEEY